jgi:RNA polymerase sigma-70 factor, ECF subfamily
MSSYRHSTGVEFVLTTTGISNDASGQTASLDVAAVYREQADFVWRSLQHLGVRDSDLEDALQEVFVVVHRKLRGFDGRSQLTTWLFGICLRVAARLRRRAYFRREQQTAEPPERTCVTTPEDRALTAERQRLLDGALARLSLEQRAIFVWFEIESRPCQEIAEIMGVPLGTVYSRLHKARKDVARTLAKAGVGSGKVSP